MADPPDGLSQNLKNVSEAWPLQAGLFFFTSQTAAMAS